MESTFGSVKHHLQGYDDLVDDDVGHGAEQNAQHLAACFQNISVLQFLYINIDFFILFMLTFGCIATILQAEHLFCTISGGYDDDRRIEEQKNRFRSHQ